MNNHHCSQMNEVMKMPITDHIDVRIFFYQDLWWLMLEENKNGDHYLQTPLLTGCCPYCGEKLDK